MSSADRKIKVGVVGVGHLGGFHAQKYAALDDAVLVGVLDTDSARAEEIGRRHGTRVFQRLDDLLESVEAVSLAVPTERHFEEASRILERNIHLLVEKPITYRVEDAAFLVAEARKRGLVLQVGHVERFSPPVIKMSSLLKDPVFVESHRMNIFTRRGTDVDVVLDLMIHDLDIVLHVAASPVRELHAVGMRVVTEATDIANARIIFENGLVANLTASRVSNSTLRKIRAFQPDAYIAVDCARRDISITQLGGAPEGSSSDGPGVVTQKHTYPDSDPLADQIASFVRAVRDGAEPEVTGEDGLKALEVALRIIDQIEQGCRNFKTLC